MDKNRTVSDFLNKEYRDYSFHIIENRAIPNIVDGFKPTQRKIIYVSFKHIKNVFNTIETLSGRLISGAQYHHGAVSAEGAIVNMSQEFKNNFPLFEKDGQFGSLKAPYASAPRYIKVKLHENFDLVYKDNELLEFKEEEGMKIEPKFYLPIIPMIIINGGSGIAVGHASNILNREIKPLIKDCISYLKGGKISQLKPSIDTFNGSFTRDKENHRKWFIRGIFNKENTSTIKISELPPSQTYERFEELLDTLLEKREITNWENLGKGVINYIVKFTREKLESLTEQDLDKMLKMTDQVTENFTVLDETGKLKIFDSAEEILKYFVDFRLTYYQKRKDHLLNKIKDSIFLMENKILFIKGVLDNKIEVRNKKKDDIIKDIIKLNIKEIDGGYDYLLSMPIYSLSKEKWMELQNSIKDKKIEEKTVKASVPKEVYLAELEELYKKIK
jgi:DNA gyrase/topoisomerase IV subunit A